MGGRSKKFGGGSDEPDKVGRHGIGVGNAAVIFNKMDNNVEHFGQDANMKAIRDILNNRQALRKMTIEGNREEMRAEKDFHDFHKEGTSFEWRTRHDRKLNQWRTQLNAQKTDFFEQGQQQPYYELDAATQQLELHRDIFKGTGRCQGRTAGSGFSEGLANFVSAIDQDLGRGQHTQPQQYRQPQSQPYYSDPHMYRRISNDRLGGFLGAISNDLGRGRGDY